MYDQYTFDWKLHLRTRGNYIIWVYQLCQEAIYFLALQICVTLTSESSVADNKYVIVSPSESPSMSVAMILNKTVARSTSGPSATSNVT